MKQCLDRFFQITEKGSTLRTEIIAGLTTFFTMAYCVVLTPNLIGQGNTQIYNGVFFANCIAAFVGTLLMALLARIPFAQASGIGLNAFFAFTVMPQIARIAPAPEGLSADEQLIRSYEMALAVVFLSGLLFILITVLGAREAIIKAIPKNVKLAISGGIGLFLAFLGLKNAGLVVADESNFVGLADFSRIGSIGAKGAILAFLGLIIIAILYKLNVKGAILIGIAVISVISYLPGIGVATIAPGTFHVDFAAQAQDFVHTSLFGFVRGFGHLFSGSNLFSAIATVLMLLIVFSMVDMFDTIGTLLGTAKKANLLDENGEMPGMKKALLCDAIATTAGAVTGTSTVTTFVESSAGIGEGGRTGMSSLVTAVLFLVALVAAPFVGLIPSVATAPALIFVGVLMISSIREVDFSDITEAVPAFLTIAMMPLTFSIANGIAFGIISYCLLKICTGKIKEVSWVAILLSVIFILRYALIR